MSSPKSVEPWKASHLFHEQGSDEASRFVRERLPLVLSGNTADAIAELRRMGVEHELRGAKAIRLRKLCAFLENNLHRMDYDLYLRAGYPISTGVIEGACRWPSPRSSAATRPNATHDT